MKQARVFSVIIVTTLALYGMIGFYCLPMASFEGSLTRMSMLPETYFGWTRAQPAIDPKLMKSSSWQEADVLVIGDSFSAKLLWQSVLTKQGLHVRTESWGWVHGVCEDFTDWARDNGFKGKYVVIESIESDVEDRLSKSVNCKQTSRGTDFDMIASPPAVQIDRGDVHFDGRMSIGILTQLNYFKYQKISRAPDFKEWLFPNKVRMLRMDNGCDLFSHRRCNDVLFLQDDIERELDKSTFDHIEKINSHMTGVIPIWVVIPNKSTVYLYPNKKYWDELEHRFNSPNVLRVFRQAVQNNIVDLYPGNEFHVSTTGSLMLGDLIYKSMIHK
jgi:hypothetical protein